MSVLDVLIAARGKIERPEDWGKGRRGRDRPIETSCAAEAIEAVTELHQMEDRRESYRAVENAAVIASYHLVDWNDAPGRTHAEVLAAFDRAITVAQLLSSAQILSNRAARAADAFMPSCLAHHLAPCLDTPASSATSLKVASPDLSMETAADRVLGSVI